MRSFSTSNRNSLLSSLKASVPSPPQPCFGGSQLWPREFRLIAGDVAGESGAVRVEFRAEAANEDGVEDCHDECFVGPPLP